MSIRPMLVHAALATILVVPLDGQQPGAWFPANAREGLARELAERLERVDVGVARADLLPAGRRAASEMVLRLDTIGVARLIDLAPRFGRLDLPLSGQPHLDAMARLGLCTYYLEARISDPSKLDEDGKLDAALGPPALALATMFLRAPYLRQGGTDEAIKAYLAGDALNAVAFAVQKDAELLRYTAGQCRAVVSALLD